MAATKKRASKRTTKRVAKPELIGADGLTDKQRAFVEHYLTCWNASEAARLAKYSLKTAGSIGSENLKKPEIRAAIDQRLKDLQLSANEVLARLADLAGADMSDFIAPSGRGFKIDLKKARALGKLHLIRKLKMDGLETSIELYDVKDALVQLGRHHALFTDNIAGKLDVTRRDKSADEMSDDELAAIAAAERDAASSRAGTPAAPASA